MAPYSNISDLYLNSVLLSDLSKHVELRIQNSEFLLADESLDRLINTAKHLRDQIWRETHISGTVNKI